MLTSATHGLFVQDHAGGSVPFLFVADHGLRADIWHSVATVLVPGGVWTPVELPGSGRAGQPPYPRPESGDGNPFDLSLQASALARLLDERDGPPPIVVGHGYSALVVERLAQHAADALFGVVLVTPVQRNIPAWQRATMQGDVGSLVARPLTDAATRALRWARRAPGDADLILEVVRYGAHTEDLRSLRVPVLLVTGDEAPFTSLSHTVSLAASAPAGHLCVLNGVGHLPMLEAPGALAAGLEAFLASCPGHRPGIAPGAWGARIDCIWPEPGETRPDPEGGPGTATWGSDLDAMAIAAGSAPRD